jgi:hypothetical protein
VEHWTVTVHAPYRDVLIRCRANLKALSNEYRAVASR